MLLYVNVGRSHFQVVIHALIITKNNANCLLISQLLPLNRSINVRPMVMELVLVYNCHVYCNTVQNYILCAMQVDHTIHKCSMPYMSTTSSAKEKINKMQNLVLYLLSLTEVKAENIGQT